MAVGLGLVDERPQHKRNFYKGWSQDEEIDDLFHDPERSAIWDETYKATNILNSRAFCNVGLLAVTAFGLLSLFAGYPLYSIYNASKEINHHGQYANYNKTGQIPWGGPRRGLIDPDTPEESRTRVGTDGHVYELVFSDEFNQDGRTFYPGDDPFWEAADMHYWVTHNLEWYSPRQATTNNGSLRLTLDTIASHDLEFEGAMLTSWNKFCFTGGYVSANVQLPGKNDVWGIWPAFWIMGNLGRAGYGATLDGMWPYTYDSCDVGTLQNQTMGDYPELAYTSGIEGKALSFLPGQRLSRCTCANEIHPGPMHEDGTFVGRSAAEIDVFEALVDPAIDQSLVSMSGQFAPFNAHYDWRNDTEMYLKYPEKDRYNEFQGGEWQQSTSIRLVTDPSAYEKSGGNYSSYGLEYNPGYGQEGYIAWHIAEENRYTVFADSMRAVPDLGISDRLITAEPMYMIINNGISNNFGGIDWDGLAGSFPNVMSIDWVRVYQRRDRINIGCDPPNMPTSAYIEYFKDAYTNPNLTTWEALGEKPVKNAILHQNEPDCSDAKKLIPDELIGHHNIKPVLPATLRPPLPAPEQPGPLPPMPPIPPAPEFSDIPENQRPKVYEYFENPPPIMRPIHNLGPPGPPSLPNAPPFDRPAPNANDHEDDNSDMGDEDNEDMIMQ
ncbi:SKN1-domain-containing protein [Wallemia mellicola]|nr:SKN1-domain-containing protein [Wallemia mellicola]